MRFPFDEIPAPIDVGRPPEHQLPEARPPRARRTWRLGWFGCGVAAGVLLIPCALLVWCSGFLVMRAAGANSALSAFCGQMKAQHYTGAYATFSARLRAEVSEERFTHANQSLDAAEGAARECRSAGNHISVSSGASELPLVLVRARTYTGTVQLIQEKGDWRIDTFDPTLELT